VGSEEGKGQRRGVKGQRRGVKRVDEGSTGSRGGE
jgi:hypothetical protein